MASVQRAVAAYSVSQERIEATRTDDLQETLENIAKLRITLVSEERGLKLQRLIETEAYRFPEIFKAAFKLGAGPSVKFLGRLFDEENRKGRLALENPKLAANVFMSMVVSGPVRFITSGNPLSDKEVNERVAFAVRLFLEGAKPR